MERVTKLLVIGSMAAAISLEAVLGARLWPAVQPLTIGSFVAAAGLSLVFEEVSAGAVLFFTYLMPQLFTVLHGDFFGPYGTVWSAALLGVVAPRSIRSSWAVPGRWKAPLILWALTIAVTWPVVAFRELDFTLDLFQYGSPGNGTAQVWICDVAVILGLGILWFDWLVNVFTGDEARFRRWILLPLGASWAIATSVGIYQMFGDMFFLNKTLFGELGRASGTMRDANPFGVVAALGGPALVAAASLTRDRSLHPNAEAELGAPGIHPNAGAALGAPGMRVIAVCGIVASWLGLWASRSRTAFAAGLIALAFISAALWSARAWQASRRTRLVLGILGLCAPVGLMAGVALLPVTSGPLSRLRNTLPTWSVLGFVKEMWNRNDYGMVATHLIREFPLFGVGVGSFHGLATHYFSLLTGGGYLPPDNAQNWYRHQLVEYGLIGSLGWILWVALFGWFVMTTRAPQPTRFAATTVKGTLVALAAVSLVGMPTQNIAVTVTLWTLAFWYVALVGAPGPAARLGPKTWLAIWTIVALSVSGTAYTSWYWLRAPQRAQADGSPYRYCFYDDEPDSDVRWTAGKAVDVFEIVRRNEDRYLKLDIGAVAPDADRRPVEIKVWRDDDLVLRLRRRSDGVATRYVCVPPGRKMMRMQVEVSRTWRPSGYGRGTDQREHGVAVGKWTFVYDPPRNSFVVPCSEAPHKTAE
jgi:hypothetical protein